MPITPLESKSREETTVSPVVMIGVLIGAIFIGSVVGFFFSRKTPSNSRSSPSPTAAQTAGIADKKTFKDSAEGVLKAGGLDGEGSFHLQRPGGVSQNAYLTSSTVDLSIYEGKKVRVWGATFNGQKAAWLMDVGLVELLSQ